LASYDATVRIVRFPTVCQSFRTKQDAQPWANRIEAHEVARWRDGGVQHGLYVRSCGTGDKRNARGYTAVVGRENIELPETTQQDHSAGPRTDPIDPTQYRRCLRTRAPFQSGGSNMRDMSA